MRIRLFTWPVIVSGIFLLAVAFIYMIVSMNQKIVHNYQLDQIASLKSDRDVFTDNFEMWHLLNWKI